MINDVYAAGTICWQHGLYGVKVLLVHRPHHNDWSFPKGKRDPGESLPETAIRETYEETDLNVYLGVPVGSIHYKINKTKQKHVYYWSAKVDQKNLSKQNFLPNKEIDQLVWLSVKEALSLLSYKQDKEILQKFYDIYTHDLLETTTIVFLRHAQALTKNIDIQKDYERKLSLLGKKQADIISNTLNAFGIKNFYSSPAKRCISTLKPSAKKISKKVIPRKILGEESWNNGDINYEKMLSQIIAKRKNSVICSHGPVIPDLIRELSSYCNTEYDKNMKSAAELPVSAFSIFHISKKNKIVSVENYPKFIS